MAKTLLLGAKAWRVVQRRRNSITLKPLDTEYPHRLIFRLKSTDERWVFSPFGSDRGSPAEWYKQIDPDHFEKISTGRW